MLKKVIVIILLSVLGGTLYADCVYNGRVYPEGALMGPYIWVNGSWIKR